MSGKHSDIGELIQAIVEAPTYRVGVRSKRKMTEDIAQRIQEQLDENLEKVRKGQRKQQKKAVDIYETLVSEWT
ncbi:MAG: IS21 family transposase, partial [Acidibacillus sp.]|nr:IS21 family transposase [Acidibacillus sp.]